MRREIAQASRRLRKKTNPADPAVLGDAKGLPGYRTVLASAVASCVLVYYYFQVTQFQVSEGKSHFQRCDYTLSSSIGFDWNATYESPCWKDLGLRAEEWKERPEKAVEILRDEGAVFLQGVLSQDEVDAVRPHIVTKHVERSRNRTYLDNPYSNLKNPVGRYELLGNLDEEEQREMVNRIIDSLSGILARAVGSDGRISEFNYLTQCKAGRQETHRDICGYASETDRNEDRYCNENYSFILATQHTPFEMGGTEVWPQSNKLDMKEGAPVDQMPIQGHFNAGDALLYNQKLSHRGGENFIHKARVMVLLTFASQWKGGPPGHDRNYYEGNYRLESLGARPQYMYRKYIPEDSERCRVECPRPTVMIAVPSKGRIINRPFYYAGKIKVADFPIRDSASLEDILSSVHDEI